jgi:RNA recognition motif-containing protein
MQTKIFVTNLSWETTVANLQELFGTYGPVVSAEISADTSRAEGRGFAFVEMATQVAAEAAIHNLNMRELNGKVLKVRFADTSNRNAKNKRRRH